MAYVSHLISSRVEDSADVHVGTLVDILIKPEAGKYAPLVFLVVRLRQTKKVQFIPYEYVENISRGLIDLNTLVAKIPFVTPPEDLVYLGRDVLDQQIVDIDGARVVRVNDIKIGLFEKKMSVLATDISFKGLLRRLSLEWLDFFSWSKVNLIDWRKTQPVKGVLRLDTVVEELTHLHPADLANIIEDLSIKQGSKLVESLDGEVAAKVFEEIEPEMQKMLMSRMGSEEAMRIMSKMSADEIVDLLQLLPKEDAGRLLGQFKNVQYKELEQLLAYEDDTAGGLMTTDFVAAPPEWTVREAIEEIKRVSPEFRTILYVYVVDAHNKFLGAVSLRRLLVAGEELVLGELVKQLPPTSTLNVSDSIDHIIRIMTKYDLYMAAVLDGQGQLKGVVSSDDIMRYFAPKA